MARATRRPRNRAKFIPRPVTPGNILNAGFDGYTHAVTAQWGNEWNIVALHRGEGCAKRGLQWVIKRLVKTTTAGSEFPEVKMISLHDLWRQVARGRSSQWLEWLVDGLLSTANTYGAEGPLSRTLALKLAREHRTIQQSFLRIIQASITRYLEYEPGTDIRNEDAVKWAKAVAAIPIAMPFV